MPNSQQCASNTHFFYQKRQLNISTPLVFCWEWQRPCRNKEIRHSEGFFHLEYEFFLLFSFLEKNLTLLACTKAELPFNRCFNSQKLTKNDERTKLVILLNFSAVFFIYFLEDLLVSPIFAVPRRLEKKWINSRHFTVLFILLMWGFSCWGMRAKLTTEDNKELVHVIFRNKSVNIPLERKKSKTEGLRGLESGDRIQKRKGGRSSWGMCGANEEQGQAAINWVLFDHHLACSCKNYVRRGWNNPSIAACPRGLNSKSDSRYICFDILT